MSNEFLNKTIKDIQKEHQEIYTDEVMNEIVHKQDLLDEYLEKHKGEKFGSYSANYINIVAKQMIELKPMNLEKRPKFKNSKLYHKQDMNKVDTGHFERKAIEEQANRLIEEAEKAHEEDEAVRKSKADEREEQVLSQSETLLSSHAQEPAPAESRETSLERRFDDKIAEEIKENDPAWKETEKKELAKSPNMEARSYAYVMRQHETHRHFNKNYLDLLDTKNVNGEMILVSNSDLIAENGFSEFEQERIFKHIMYPTVNSGLGVEQDQENKEADQKNRNLLDTFKSMKETMSPEEKKKAKENYFKAADNFLERLLGIDLKNLLKVDSLSNMDPKSKEMYHFNVADNPSLSYFLNGASLNIDGFLGDKENINENFREIKAQYREEHKEQYEKACELTGILSTLMNAEHSKIALSGERFNPNQYKFMPNTMETSKSYDKFKNFTNKNISMYQEYLAEQCKNFEEKYH